MDASEREQYRTAIHGDREAFEMIIRTHSRTLFAIAYGILQNREEAEDVVQDTLLAALEKEGGLARLYSGLRREKTMDFLLSKATKVQA